MGITSKHLDFAHVDDRINNGSIPILWAVSRGEFVWLFVFLLASTCLLLSRAGRTHVYIE